MLDSKPEILGNEVDLLIGGKLGTSDFFHGQIDEIRVSREARTAEWVKLCYGRRSYGGICASSE
jgi:hypothetical protein